MNSNNFSGYEQNKKLLEKEYTELFKNNENRPDWSVKKISNPAELIHPAIPFLGKNYANTRLLLYASAENLVGYNGYLDPDLKAINRRRDFYNGSLRDYEENNKPFFPEVHIAPVEDGSLIIVSAYILKLLGVKLDYSNPYNYLENIAIDNFCKFSIDRKKSNKDYAGNFEYIKYSLNYIKADLKILKPDIVIMPKVIYGTGSIKQLFKEIVPDCKVIPIYQINSRNINHPKRIKRYFKKPDENIDEQFILWQKYLSNGITGKTNKNFNSVYTYINAVIKNIPKV